jgi:predicted Rossmann-fold nucleotide-binding protein
MPIILLHEPFWHGILAWFRDRLVGDGMIDANECGLLQVVNEPREVLHAIFDFYEKRGFEPSPAEREALLNL